jgi:hypothetical protein
MSRIENALGKISLESVRRKKAGLAQFEHPLIVIEVNKLRKALQAQRTSFFQALAKLGGRGSVRQIADIMNAESEEIIPDLHIKYMAAYLLENNRISAKVENENIIYLEGSMTDEEYIDFYKKLIPIMEKRGVIVKPWVKENINKLGPKS